MVSSLATEVEGTAREIYQSRLVPAQEAAAQIKSHDRIWLPVGHQVGMIVAALTARYEELEDVEVSMVPVEDYGWYNEEIRPHIRVNALFGTAGAGRTAVNDGLADFTPWWLWGGHKAADDGRADARPMDVSILCVSPPNRQGYCCLGANLWDSKTTAKRSKTVIAAVNPHVPLTFGDTWLHVSEIDWFVEDDQPPPERSLAFQEPDPWDQPIAEYIGSLIQDGDVLQIGTGSTSGNIPRSGVLDGKHDLAYFGELTVPGTIDLVKRGVITGRHLAAHPGKFLATSAGNGAADRAFIDGNPMFEFYAPEYMHHPGVIARNDNQVSINNALSVDLNGQIASGHLGARVWSGTGGHFAYALGSFLSKGGRYICVLPSTAVRGTQSRIVPQFQAGQVVTIPQDLADIVVTEYGIARLLNKNLRDRANELIAVAHPDFRAELRRQAGGR